MNNEQEIERMAKILKMPTYIHSQDIDRIKILPCNEELAARLVSHGYGDKKQAVKEFVDRLKEDSYYFAGAEYVEVRDIDELFTELYGVEK